MPVMDPQLAELLTQLGFTKLLETSYYTTYDWVTDQKHLHLHVGHRGAVTLSVMWSKEDLVFHDITVSVNITVDQLKRLSTTKIEELVEMSRAKIRQIKQIEEQQIELAQRKKDVHAEILEQLNQSFER